MYTITLPSGIEAEIREMTGAEEEILTNQKLIRSGNAINQVFQNCLLRLGENEKPGQKEVFDLLSGDRLALLVHLRRVSLGDEVELELRCNNPGCGVTQQVTINLEDLSETPYGEEREFSYKLPSSGNDVKFIYLDGHMEKRLASIKDANITTAMLMRIKEINGAAPSKKLMNDMSMRDRSALRKEMNRVDAGIDTTLDVDCEACGARIRTRLEAEAGFLFPGVRL